MPQPSCMCTVLLKLAKVERLKMKVVACYYMTLIYFSDLLKTIAIRKTSPYDYILVKS